MKYMTVKCDFIIDGKIRDELNTFIYWGGGGRGCIITDGNFVTEIRSRIDQAKVSFRFEKYHT